MKVFEFGPFQLNPETVRLFKDGVEVELEPQVFDALLLLLENHDRVVSKQEMFEQLWQGRTLTDHVITRIIYELRKVLDVKESDQSYIRTVRGKGYQFSHPLNASRHEESQVPQPVTERVKGGQKVRWLLAFLVLVVIMILAYIKIPEQNNHQSSSKSSVMAVLPIDLESQSDEVSVFSNSIIDQMTAQLGQNLNMRIIHPNNMMTLQQHFHDLWAIQQATRADYILAGQVEQFSDSNIKISFNLHQANDAGQLTPFSLGSFLFPYPTTSKELKELYKQQRITVREIVQLIKPGVTIRAAGYNETDDPEAYRMILQAHHLMRKDSCKEILQSEQLLKKATERDPEFAYAWFQLFAHYFKLVYVCGESTENYQKALVMAEKVEQLAPGKYKALTIGRNVMLTETNQVEKAYQYVMDVNWDDPLMLNMKVYALRFAGFLNHATTHIDRILQLDPFFYNKKPIYQAPNSLYYLGEYEAYINLLAEPGNAYHDYYRGLSLVLSGQVDQARPLLKTVFERTPNDLFGQFSEALYLVINQQNQAAKVAIDKIGRQRLEKQHFDGEMAYKLAQLYAMSNHKDKAIEYFQAAVDQGFFAYIYFIQDPALDPIRNHPTFVVILEQALKRHVAFAERFNLEPEIN